MQAYSRYIDKSAGGDGKYKRSENYISKCKNYTLIPMIIESKLLSIIPHTHFIH